MAEVHTLKRVIMSFCGGGKHFSCSGYPDHVAWVPIMPLFVTAPPPRMEHHNQYSRDTCLVLRILVLSTSDFYLKINKSDF